MLVGDGTNLEWAYGENSSGAAGWFPRSRGQVFDFAEGAAGAEGSALRLQPAAGAAGVYGVGPALEALPVAGRGRLLGAALSSLAAAEGAYVQSLGLLVAGFVQPLEKRDSKAKQLLLEDSTVRRNHVWFCAPTENQKTALERVGRGVTIIEKLPHPHACSSSQCSLLACSLGAARCEKVAILTGQLRDLFFYHSEFLKGCAVAAEGLGKAGPGGPDDERARLVAVATGLSELIARFTLYEEFLANWPGAQVAKPP